MKADALKKAAVEAPLKTLVRPAHLSKNTMREACVCVNQNQIQ
jgi:hypothetical protein